MTEWWLVALLLIPAGFLQTFLHESSHAIAVSLCGGEVVSFKFWPHRVGQIILFGRVVHLMSPRCRTPRRRALMALAPFIAGLPMLWILIELVAAYQPVGMILAFALAVGTALSVDLIRGLTMPLWAESRGDLNKGMSALGLSRKVFVGPAICCALGVAAAWGATLWIFLDLLHTL